MHHTFVWDWWEEEGNELPLHILPISSIFVGEMLPLVHTDENDNTVHMVGQPFLSRSVYTAQQGLPLVCMMIVLNAFFCLS